MEERRGRGGEEDGWVGMETGPLALEKERRLKLRSVESPRVGESEGRDEVRRGK